MRIIRCRACDEKWSPRRGTVHRWYERHLQEHGLEEPKRQEGEATDTYLQGLIDWRDQYFEDSLYPYWKSLIFSEAYGLTDEEEAVGTKANADT